MVPLLATFRADTTRHNYQGVALALSLSPHPLGALWTEQARSQRHCSSCLFEPSHNVSVRQAEGGRRAERGRGKKSRLTPTPFNRWIGASLPLLQGSLCPSAFILVNQPDMILPSWILSDSLQQVKACAVQLVPIAAELVFLWVSAPAHQSAFAPPSLKQTNTVPVILHSTTPRIVTGEIIVFGYA